jgi:alpha-beta hydrolase superfamily lysophospholipase
VGSLYQRNKSAEWITSYCRSNPLQISEFTIAGAHGPLTCSLAQPDGPIRPGLLLTLGMSRQSALTEHPHNLSARLFLAAGYQVLSFDLPCHGSRVGFWGAGLDGMASAIAGGADPFEELVADGRAVLDHCISHGIGGGGKVLTIGVSRAGYCALRLAAADRRIAGVAGLAPVTDWRRLTEFTAIAERTETAALALDHWAAEFVGRPVFLAIGNADERVGTDCCARFALELFCAEARRGIRRSHASFHIVSAEGHALPDEWRSAGATFLLEYATNAG